MCVAAHTVNYDSDYGTSIVSAFVIEKDSEIKEKFSYEILFNRTTQLSLVAYSQANYGPEAVFRFMTDEEKADFITPPLRILFGQNDKVWSKL